MSDEYKALSKEWPIDELNALRARVKELEAKLAAAESRLERANDTRRTVLAHLPLAPRGNLPAIHVCHDFANPESDWDD